MKATNSETFTCVGRLICPEGRVSLLNKFNPIPISCSNILSEVLVNWNIIPQKRTILSLNCHPMCVNWISERDVSTYCSNPLGFPSQHAIRIISGVALQPFYKNGHIWVRWNVKNRCQLIDVVCILFNYKYDKDSKLKKSHTSTLPPKSYAG